MVVKGKRKPLPVYEVGPATTDSERRARATA